MTTQTANKSAKTGQVHRKLNEIDMNKLTFGEPEINKYGGKSCKIEYDGQPLTFQTPRCRVPFGLGRYDETDPSGNVLKSKYSLDLSLAGYELKEDGTAYDPRVRQLYDLASALEIRLREEALKNSGEWLDMEDASEGVIKALTRPLLRWSKDKKTKKITTVYAPTVKAKVGFWDNRWLVNAFDENKERINDLNEGIVKGSEVIAIVKLQGVNFAGGKVGYSLSLSQVKVYAPKGMPAYAFVEDEEDETPVVTGTYDRPDEDEDDVPVPAPVNTVEDSDDDDDDDDGADDLDQESEEEAPEPPKKVIRRKPKK
jgi:hypothetical protein